MRTVSILGTGSYIPEKVITNADLAKIVDTNDEWIVSRTGMKERHQARPDEAASDMGAAAARQAMESAGVTADQIGMIVCASITPDMPFPSTACYVQRLIGAHNAFCLDITAACSGFIYALELAKNAICAGQVDTALIIGTEKLTSVVDWQDRQTCVLFGDAAGAAIVGARGAPHGIRATALGSDGRLAELLMLPGGGSRNPTSPETIEKRLHYMKMSGRDVFKHAVTRMIEACQKAIAKAGLTIDDIALIIPHQANLRIIEAIGHRLGAPAEKYFINIEKYGNISAASIPVALDEAVRSDRIKQGDKIVLVAFGGGFTWGAAVVEWDKN
ncbi:MAG: ketoacyl-ACP synthase III [Verrucomicrobia bacterium]|nr:MAG: ketoacyl-ACP synthase III [Verrucomicrobiota bacterium]